MKTKDQGYKTFYGRYLPVGQVFDLPNVVFYFHPLVNYDRKKFCNIFINTINYHLSVIDNKMQIKIK